MDKNSFNKAVDSQINHFTEISSEETIFSSLPFWLKVDCEASIISFEPGETLGTDFCRDLGFFSTVMKKEKKKHFWKDTWLLFPEEEKTLRISKSRIVVENRRITDL